MYTYVQTVCTRKGVRGGMESEGKEWRSEEEE